MKKTARITAWLAGACGLLLAACGTASAQAPLDLLGGGDGVYGNDTNVNFEVELVCSQRAATCVNGPVNSGNVSHAENVQIGGNANHSGSPDNINGTHNAGNESHGASSQSDNNWQSVGRNAGRHR